MERAEVKDSLSLSSEAIVRVGAWLMQMKHAAMQAGDPTRDSRLLAATQSALLHFASDDEKHPKALLIRAKSMKQDHNKTNKKPRSAHTASGFDGSPLRYSATVGFLIESSPASPKLVFLPLADADFRSRMGGVLT